MVEFLALHGPRFGDGGGENPYAIHEELRSMMQSLVGIVRTENEMQEALRRLADYGARAERVGHPGLVVAARLPPSGAERRGGDQLAAQSDGRIEFLTGSEQSVPRTAHPFENRR